MALTPLGVLQHAAALRRLAMALLQPPSRTPVETRGPSARKAGSAPARSDSVSKGNVPPELGHLGGDDDHAVSGVEVNLLIVQ